VSIQERLGRQLFHLRLVEEALYGDPGTWEMSFGPLRQPVSVRVEEPGVVFRVAFPATKDELPDEVDAVLWHGGEMRATRRVRKPEGLCSFAVTWSLGVGEVALT
jgi:hypothetical protein